MTRPNPTSDDPAAKDPHMATPTARPKARQSMHERIMADPEARAMYFCPNDGFLRTSPRHQDADRIVEVLDDHNLCYLHERDTSYPRPRFYWQGNVSIGLDEITDAAETISAALAEGRSDSASGNRRPTRGTRAGLSR